jgi:hypothetical protein
MDVTVGRWKQMFLHMCLNGSAHHFPWYGYDEVIISIIVSKLFTYHRNITLLARVPSPPHNSCDLPKIHSAKYSATLVLAVYALTI